MQDNAPIIIRPETLRAIHEHVEHARKKWAWGGNFLLSAADQYRIVERELHEMAVAMLKGDARGVKKEALDCIAVLIRVAEGDGE